MSGREGTDRAFNGRVAPLDGEGVRGAEARTGLPLDGRLVACKEKTSGDGRASWDLRKSDEGRGLSVGGDHR